MATKIEDLLNNDVFTNRHIGSSSAQKQKMLDYLGFENLDDLIEEIVVPTATKVPFPKVTSDKFLSVPEVLEVQVIPSEEVEMGAVTPWL